MNYGRNTTLSQAEIGLMWLWWLCVTLAVWLFCDS